MTPVVLANIINPNAARVLEQSKASGTHLSLAVISRTLDRSRRVCEDLRPYIIAGVRVAPLSENTLRNLRGRPCIHVIVCDGVIFKDVSQRIGVESVLRSSAAFLNCTVENLLTNEYGESL